MSKEQFKGVLINQVQCWSEGAQFLFLERLFNAFDVDNSNSIDCEEFMTGLSIFLKGTPEEKMMLSFRIYDVDKSGSIEPKELIKIMSQLYSAFFNNDQTAHVKALVTQIFDDLDINGDESLSITEVCSSAFLTPV
jgi:Ca2+-binding EF-hand superfamily protein